MNTQNQREILTKMKLFKDYRQDKISKQNGQVLDVKYLGNIAKSEDKKDELLAIYMIIERYKKDGQFVEVEQYFSEDLQNKDIQFLAGNNKSDGIEKIYLSDKYIDDDNIREYLEDAINTISKEGELDLATQEQIASIAKELGIDVEDIQSMAKLNDNEESGVYEKEDEDGEEQEEQDSDEKSEKQKDKDDTQLTKSQTKKVTRGDTKQEVNINDRFDGIHTLRDELGLSAEYKSIVVVYSERLREVQGTDGKTNNAPVSFLAIKNDGSAEVIDSLELDTSEGVVPIKESIKIDADGTARQDANTLARYRTPKGYLSIQRGQYGEMKVYHGQKTKEENRPVEFQVETVNIRPLPIEMRELQRPGQGEYHIDNMEDEFASHVEHGEKELKNRADYDGDKKTSTHKHDEEQNVSKDGFEETTKQMAEILMKNDSISEVFSNREVQNMVKNYCLKHSGETIKLEDVEKNIEQDADMYLGHQRNSH